MSLNEVFLTVYPFLCFFLVNGAILAVVLPNRICNTRSTNSHWIVVCLIAGGLFGVRGEVFPSLTIVALMSAGILVHWIRSRESNSYMADVLPGQTTNFVKRVK